MRKTNFAFILTILVLILLGACADAEKPESTPESSATLEVYNAKKDFIYIDITMQEADSLFGEVIVEYSKEDYYWGGNLYIGSTQRKYEGVWCTFKRTEEGKQEILLRSMTVFSPNYAPVRGIKVGDSLDSVLAKFPNENQELITNEYGDSYKLVYGAPEPGLPYGRIEYEEGLPVNVNFCDATKECGVFNLQLDSNLCVSSIFVSYTYR